jgi:hypothetical protein
MGMLTEMLAGPVVAVGLLAAAGCGGSSLFTSKETLTCFQHRTEYARELPGFVPPKHLVINAFANRPDDTILSLNHAGLAGTMVAVRFEGPGAGTPSSANIDTASIYFFGQKKQALEFYDARVRPQPAAYRDLVRQEIQQQRNVVVWWTPPDPSPGSRRILFGCLR